jgi:hypothetical protein
MKQPPTVEEQHKIAEEIVDTSIEWENDERGYFLCPMHEGHTTPTKDKHTICYLDGVPTFFCWHQTCKEWMELASSELREKLDFRTPEQKTEDRMESNIKAQLRCDAIRLRGAFDRIYKEYGWDEVFETVYSAEESWRFFLSLWDPLDVIWIGDVWDTGPKKGAHFAPRCDWENRNVDFYHNRFTSGSTYKPLTEDRTQANVLVTKYTIVEFDHLDTDPYRNKRKGAALLNYLRPSFDLRMVVDSGNKSVHGHFANDVRMTNDAKYFLRHLGADINTMRPSQPVRLPGGRRENGRIQSVLYVSD